MTAGKLKNGNQGEAFPSMLNGIIRAGINGGGTVKNTIPNDDQDADQKEVIRRLKIQNTKLLQQVSSLRKKVKQQGRGKKQVVEYPHQPGKMKIRIEFLR
jgi:hypothetical protein